VKTPNQRRDTSTRLRTSQKPSNHYHMST
jgi:hypothetical protein